MSERDASERRGDRTSTSFHGRVDPPGRGGRGRGPRAFAAWAIGLGAVVAIAVAGPRTTVDPVTAPASAAPSAELRRSIRLDQPARRGEVVTSREVIVRGRVAESVGQVWIMLESRGGKPIATRAIDPTGMPRGDMIPFESRFRIAMPRPAGSLVVAVVALGPDGTPVDAVRRRFELGAIIDIPRLPAE